MAKNWAIAIGINNYTHLHSLDYAKKDAQSMGDFFQQELGFEGIFLFTENSPPVATSTGPIPTRPTFGDLGRFLRLQFESPLLEPGDNLWFFFSGHGLHYEGHDYLFLSDTDPGDIKYTALPLSYVTERLKRSGADNIILLLDACWNQEDSAGEGIGKEPQQGVVTIYSCGANEKAYEIPSLQQGSFTYAALEALQIQGENNCATVERLGQYLYHRVPEINRQYQQPPQTPYAIVEPSQSQLIIVPRYATFQDIDTLKLNAYRAESQDDLELAKQLWIRVNAATTDSDPDVIKAFLRISQLSATASPPLTSPSRVRTTTATISPQPTSPRLPLLEFDVVTVDNQGQEIERHQGTAHYFTEDLGKGVSLEMVAIPAGNFQMGSPDTEEQRRNFESPQHKVTVPSFCMGNYPISQAQWQAIATLPPINRELDPNPSQFPGRNLPVERVSWYDVVEFCARLSQKTGREYRLPSEAEWEYACRGGTTTPFHFGETITTDLGNYDGNDTYGLASQGKYREQTTPVGSFQVANAFGLYDMHGNVYEWCADHWHKDYEGAPTDGSIWLNNKDNQSPRVLRGGSWVYNPWFCRAAYRDCLEPDLRSHGIGFRVVCRTAWVL
ncbi:MAG: SUMF1/EgtB/PvdO family nonheme iron enzyme [Symploca sp. SIO1C2]|nr:SUMF1/EgtB/PvdO family nonheme iron enzyme [Symploca sp. SIO1C2]NER45363.1 SUMF1/EgtB/PvdO family nonheme iron enzyme [Symploca sp. SIO1A3]